jgi:hypothetical protein
MTCEQRAIYCAPYAPCSRYHSFGFIPIPAAFNKTLAPHHPVLNFDSAENRN